MFDLKSEMVPLSAIETGMLWWKIVLTLLLLFELLADFLLNMKILILMIIITRTLKISKINVGLFGRFPSVCGSI